MDSSYTTTTTSGRHRSHTFLALVMDIPVAVVSALARAPTQCAHIHVFMAKPAGSHRGANAQHVVVSSLVERIQIAVPHVLAANVALAQNLITRFVKVSLDTAESRLVGVDGLVAKTAYSARCLARHRNIKCYNSRRHLFAHLWILSFHPCIFYRRPLLFVRHGAIESHTAECFLGMI